MEAFIKKMWPMIVVGAFILVPKVSFAADWVNIGYPNNNIKTVFVNPKNNQNIIISLTSYIDNNYDYYSEDGGSTWSPVGMGGAMTPCNNFAINPKNVKELWAGCSVGLYRSTDGGKNFNVIDKYRTTQGVNVSISSDGVIYMASTGNNLHKSVDGIFWEVLSAPGGSSLPVVFLNKLNPNEIYVSAVNSGLYKSNDMGTTWALLNNQAQIRSGIGQMTFSLSGKICASVSTVGIGCSEDGGFSWSTFVSPNSAKPVEYQHFYQLVQNPDDDENLLVLAGTWGGLDTKIYNYKSGTPTPEVMAIPQSFSSITVSQGVVFAWSFTASWTKGLWRNDGIAVVPEYLMKHPVIIVPGILGSWFVPSTGMWELDPILKTYDDLYNNFVNAGYEPGKSLFTFPYQWRNDNKYTAGLLANKINEVKAKSGSNKVDIIAHSMGGLVTRFYAESDIYNGDINQIFFLGTPQLGSTKAYPLWENGYTGFEEDTRFRILLNFILSEESLTNGYKGVNAVKDYIHERIPSVQQLLPTYSYLNANVYPEGYPLNSDLEILNQNKQILLNRNIKVTNIIGDTGPITLNKLTVNSSMNQPTWDHGEPIGLKAGNIYEGVIFAHGDETVNIESQSYIPGINYQLDNVKHSEIPKKAIGSIFTELGIETAPKITDTVNKILMIKAYSPVDFYVVAPDGKKIGFNKDGGVFNEVDGAFYTGNDSETEFLTIPNPLPGEYRVMTYGTGTGDYKIEANYADDENNTSISSSYQGQATLGKEDKILVKFAPNLGTIETQIEDKTSPTTEVNVTGAESNGYYNSDVTVSLVAIDTESGVKKTEYSTDGIAWQSYTTPLIFTTDGEMNVAYRSEDKAGNLESPRSLVLKIDKSAPVVVVNTNKSTFTRWDSLVAKCSVTDNYSGVHDFTVQFDGTVIDCTKPINLMEKNFGSYKIEYLATDNAGNTTSGEILLTVIANYESTISDILWLYETGQFKARGNAISLIAQIEVSSLFSLIGSREMAENMLEHTMSALVSQFDKSKITSFGYDMIKKDINYILEVK